MDAPSRWISRLEQDVEPMSRSGMGRGGEVYGVGICPKVCYRHMKRTKRMCKPGGGGTIISDESTLKVERYVQSCSNIRFRNIVTLHTCL